MSDNRNLLYDFTPPTNPTESDILTNQEMQRAEAVIQNGRDFQNERMPYLLLYKISYNEAVLTPKKLRKEIKKNIF